MGEIRDGQEEPEHVNRPEMRRSDDTGAARQRVEPRSRADYAVELERHVALVTFEPRRAGLPEVSIKDATAYLDKHHAERPWLSVARDCPPEVQRIFAALDQGGGHAHIRHEGWVTEEMNERRLRNLEDPAQLDPAKRAAGIDGLARSATGRTGAAVSLPGLPDPEAFAIGSSPEASGIRTCGRRWAPNSGNGGFRRRSCLPIAEVLGP